eukprot:1203031-Prymnesium_polylepis.2
MRVAAIETSPAHESRKAKPRKSGSTAPAATPCRAARTKSVGLLDGWVPRYRMGSSVSCSRLAANRRRVTRIDADALSQLKWAMPVLRAWVMNSTDSSSIDHAPGRE